MSYAHDRGYKAEHAIETFLQGRGHMCWRPRAGALADRGDIAGIPIVISVKDHTTLALGSWVGDLPRMVLASGLETGVVWHKRRGSGDPRMWYVTTTGAFFLPFYDAYVAAAKQACP